MQMVRCPVHDIVFNLPVTKEEMVQEKFHLEIQRCDEHKEKYPECRLEDISNIHETTDVCKCGHKKEYHFSTGCFSGDCPCKENFRSEDS